MVKDELTSEEKFFEKAVVTERFVKKYKNVMIGSVIALTLFVAGSIVYSASEKSRITEANQLLTKLSQNANSSAEIASLKSLSPALYDVWSYSNAVATKNLDELKKLQTSKVTFIGDLSSYAVADSSAEVSALNDYAQKQESVYKDLAIVQSAVILMNENKTDKAHEKLRIISVNSPLAKVASALMHYGVK
jgi:hypothetical protein